MKTTIPVLVVALFCLQSQSSFAQKKKVEWNVYAGSGVFFFSGDDASDDITAGNGRYGDGFSGAFGKKAGLSWFAGFSFVKPLRQNLLYGLRLEIQSLVSKADIVRHLSYSPVPFPPSTIIPASGTSANSIRFIALNPLFGKRFKLGRMTLDADAGPEAAIAISFKRKLDYTANGQSYESEMNWSDADAEIRARIQVKLNLGKLGILAGYNRSFITTYHDDVPLGYGKMDLTSHFIRLGVGYKL